MAKYIKIFKCQIVPFTVVGVPALAVVRSSLAEHNAGQGRPTTRKSLFLQPLFNIFFAFSVFLLNLFHKSLKTLLFMKKIYIFFLLFVCLVGLGVHSYATCVTTANTMAACSINDQAFTNGGGAQNGTAPNPSCGWGTGSASTSTWIHFTYAGPTTMKYLYAGQDPGGAGNNPAAAVYTNDGCTVKGCITNDATPAASENASDAKLDLTTMGLTIGQTYLRRVYNEGNTANAKTAQIRCVPQDPCGDNYNSPCVVSNINTTFTSGTNGAHPTDGCLFPIGGSGGVDQLNCPGPGAISVDGNVWYAFSVCTAGTVTATLDELACNDGKGSQIWMLSGNCNGGNANFTILGGNCSNIGDMSQVVQSYTFSAGQVGTIFYILVDSYGGNRCDFNLTLTGPVCILPTDLVNFSGRMNRSQEVVLTWQTTAEMNNDYFTVERSTNGINFSGIGRVNSQGNSSAPRFYAYTDHQPDGSVNYYRLRQTNLDGTHKNTPPIVVRNSMPTSGFIIFPNPVTDNIKLEIDTKFNIGDNYSITITDIAGKIIWKKDITAANGQDSYLENISTSGFGKGTYFITVNHGDNSEVKKFIKL
jgi:hypothetical protein